MKNPPHAIAIGASAGGIEALLALAQGFPARFPAIILVTQHVGSLPSMLPELLRFRSRNPALHPNDGDAPVPGTLYVAPPDRHMLVEGGKIRLVLGPKENHSRPAIDPMFRSVALEYGSRAIAVVLTGLLDDGSAGLKAVKACGGIAVVQDPATAMEPGMPQAALDNVDVDHCVTVREMPALFQRLVAAPEGARDARHGTGDEAALRSHALTARSLKSAQDEPVENAMRSSVRALQKREILLRRVAVVARAQGDHAQAAVCDDRADDAKSQAERLTRMIESEDRGG